MWFEKKLEVLRPQLERLSDEIWDYSELKFCEYKSAKAHEDLLENAGFQVQHCVAGMDTAFLASYGQGRPVVGILAEYDALSGLSQVSMALAPAARKGTPNGHGCGHHLLGAGALGGALLLSEYLKDSGHSGTVKLIGCPGEEGGSGKTYMARSGVFNDLDIALTWHPAGGYSVLTGAMQANCQAYFRFTGISSHAACAPHLGRSALDAVEMMNIGANYMREHMEPTDRIHYAVLDTGGNSPNVVQSHANVLYLIRSENTEKVKELYRRVCNIAEGAAKITETSVDINFDKGCSNTLSNSVLEFLLYQCMKDIPLPLYTEDELAYAENLRAACCDDASLESDLSLSYLSNAKKQPYIQRVRKSAMADFIVDYQHSDACIGGSSDVGDCSYVVPTAQFTAASFVPGTPGHSWIMTSQGKSSIAKKGMLYAAAVLAEAGKRIFEEPEIVKNAILEFNGSTGGKPYVCPIPPEIQPHSSLEELLIRRK